MWIRSLAIVLFAFRAAIGVELVRPPSVEVLPTNAVVRWVTDDDRGFNYAQWRKQWCELGMKWSSRQPPPHDWNASAQLAALKENPRAITPRPAKGQ